LAFELAEDEDSFLLANVGPEQSGLPFLIYISERQGIWPVHIKVAEAPGRLTFRAAVCAHPPMAVIAGELTASELTSLRRWIDLNREVIVGHCTGDIEGTADALDALVPLRT